jgi:hypothetical protein
MFHHLPWDVTGDAQHFRFRRASLQQFCDALMPKAVEPKSSQSSGPCEIAPRRTPCLLRPCSVKVVVFTGGKHLEPRPRNSKFGRPFNGSTNFNGRLMFVSGKEEATWCLLLMRSAVEGLPLSASRDEVRPAARRRLR